MNIEIKYHRGTSQIRQAPPGDQDYDIPARAYGRHLVNIKVEQNTKRRLRNRTLQVIEDTLPSILELWLES